MKTLLVWNEFENGVKYFFLDSLSEEEFNLLCRINKKYIGLLYDDVDKNEKTNDLLKVYVAVTDEDKKIYPDAGRWLKNKVPSNSPIKIDGEFVIIECGFVP